MPYIGNTSPSRFVSNRAASVYSGDGSTTAFTLEQAVVQDEDILVSVDGVVQEPSVAYAVSNGTTLTFTGAPSSNAGNNIFVYYLASQVGTVGHPSNQALSATNGTFSGNTTVAGTGTFTGDVTIGDASAADKKILFDGNAQDYHIGLDDSADTLVIGKGSALGTTTAMSFDANGIITKPLQPAFLADCNYVESNLAINASHTVPALNERFDQNSDYNNSTYTFTAPVTGKYQLNCNFYVHFFDDSTNYVEFIINTSNRIYRGIIDNSLTPGDVDNYNNCVSVLADMDASDTAHMQINIPNSGTAQMRHSNLMTFSGYLVA